MEDNIYRLLGRRVKTERQAAGLTLVQLGEKAGITGAFVAHIEAARKSATLKTVAKIAHALGLSPSELISTPNQSENKDQVYLLQLSRLLRSKTPTQKRLLLDLVKKAAELSR